MNAPLLAQAPGPGMEQLIQIFPFILVIFIFYFLLIRPQQKRAKDHQALVNAVKRGDTVVTAGGIVGKVTRVGQDGEIRVEIADGVQVRVLKSTLSEVRGRGEGARDRVKSEPVPANDDDNIKPASGG